RQRAMGAGITESQIAGRIVENVVVAAAVLPIVMTITKVRSSPERYGKNSSGTNNHTSPIPIAAPKPSRYQEGRRVSRPPTCWYRLAKTSQVVAILKADASQLRKTQCGIE